MAPDVPGLTIRTANAGDEAILLEWRNEPEFRRWFHDPEPVDPDGHAAWLRGQLRRSPPTIWIAELDGQPVGSVRLDPAGDGTEVVSVVVASMARGRGIGTLLLDWAAAQALAIGCPGLVAEVHPGNTASHALFTGAGYEPIPSTGFPRYRKLIPARG